MSLFAVIVVGLIAGWGASKIMKAKTGLGNKPDFGCGRSHFRWVDIHSTHRRKFSWRY